jgi:hemoglobin-like flavoprotein
MVLDEQDALHEGVGSKFGDEKEMRPWSYSAHAELMDSVFVMKLSPRETELVRSTFALVEPKFQIAALAFHQRLFALSPALRSRLRSNIDAESEELMALLRVVVDFADRPAMLRTVLADPDVGCASYDAGAEYHEVVGEALLWSLAMTLGQSFTPEARAAWAELHALVGEILRDRPPTKVS